MTDLGKRSMAIVRPFKPNIAEMCVYRPFLDRFDLTFYFTGMSQDVCRGELDAMGLQRMKAVRFASYTDFIPSEFVRRLVEFKVGFGSYMFSHLHDVLSHDYVNVVDPIYGFTHQIAGSIRPDQKLIVVRWENIYGRYDRVWTAARRAKRVLERADLIICTSEAALSTVCLESGQAVKMVRIYPGIDLRTLPSNGFGTSARNGNSPGEKGRPVMLFVGRLQWTKGLQTLLVALSILRQRKVLEVDLWVIGGGDKAPFESLVGKLGLQERVQFFGALSNGETRAKMAKGDLFCFPSLLSPNWMEQYGFALVEAMAQGLPVVAFDSGSIREICGQDAFYASAGNAHSLAEEIAKALNDRAASMAQGEKLRKRAFCEFDADRQGRKLMEAIFIRSVERPLP